MKKRLIALFLALSLVTLCSCSYFRSMRDMIRDLREINNARQYGYDENGEADYTFDREIVDTIDERFEKLEEMLNEDDESRSGAFTALFNLQSRDLYYLSDHADIAYTDFCSDPSNETYSDLYDEISKLLSSRVARLYRMYAKIHDGKMSDTFYDGWDEEEIEHALELSKQYSDAYVEMTDTVNEYVQQYDQLDFDAPSFGNQSARLYKQIVEENRTIAKSLGCDRYEDYAYGEIYGRDFTPEDGRTFHRYVKEYVVPLGTKLLRELRNSDLIGQVESIMNGLEHDNVSKTTLVDKLTPYYKKLGSKNEEAFQSFLKNYKSVSGSKAREIAFTTYLNYYDHPVCYFGPSNQNLMTYIHEQGHFLSFFKSKSNVNSLDLCETQSQGNEWLFIAYSKNDYTADVYELLCKYKMFNDTITVVLATCCDLFEQKVYADPGLGAEDYDALFREAVRELGAESLITSVMSYSPEEYWHRAIVSNSFYYISYAVSLIPVIEMFVTAEENGFEKAVEIYNKYTVCDTDAGFVETLNASGLSSPFEESVYVRIRDFFTK